MKVVFRAETSTKIGSTHLMHCLTLSESLRENGSTVMFICRKYTVDLNHLFIQ